MTELVAVRDLDLVRDDAWPEALDLIAGDPALRAALLTPVRLTGPAGGAVEGPSYTAWWLRSRLAGGGAWADPDGWSDPEGWADSSGSADRNGGGLAGLLPPAPPELAGADPAIRAALGAVRGPEDLDAEAVADVLDGLSDPDAALDAATALRIWAALAGLQAALGTALKGEGADSPGLVRVLAGDGTVVVDADEACVVGRPDARAARRPRAASSWRQVRSRPPRSRTCSTCRSPRTSPTGWSRSPSSGCRASARCHRLCSSSFRRRHVGGASTTS